ncbi:MAG TPA: hydrogenase expression protein HypE [Casimicrobiaceae bacterium]|nr:hydrogenase expression protein HypE [Casimicrobiaceae bacterium]
MPSSPALYDLIRTGRLVEAHHPWPRAVISADDWRQAGGSLAAGEWTLLGLWGEPDQVHMALNDERHHEIGVVTCACDNARFPSIGRMHAPAIRLERALRDLWSLEPEGLDDIRPWLDHGTWRRAAASAAAANAQRAGRAYAFLPTEGESLHQIPVGPVHAGIIEPGHFRFTANGETVVRLEARLGYVHKGTESLMAGAPVDRAAVLAGRVSGDSTVAYALAFAHAIEVAHRIEVPVRAVWLRALMAELERLANHCGDIGAVCNDAAFAMMHAQCGHLREQVLRVAEHCFGHRLMMDRVVPGGLQQDLQRGGENQLHSLLAHIRRRFPELVELYDNTASLQDRTVGTGVLSPELARQYGCGGYVGRASGRGFDARRTPGYPPYDALQFEVPGLEDGDVNARLWIRIREVEQSLALIEQILEQLPGGPIRAPMTLQASEAHEGMALVEGFRGDVLVWLRTGADGNIERCHLRDPSWFQWPVLEAAIEGNIVADFPLCNKSFNCSYSGHDL